MNAKRFSSSCLNLVLAVSLASIAEPSAQAWVHKNYRDLAGYPNVDLKTKGTLSFSIERQGANEILDASDIEAIRSAMRELSTVAGSTATVRDAGFFDMATPKKSRDGLKADGVSRIYFFSDPDPSFSSVAVTVTTFNSQTGEITEADIALNEADYVFSTTTPDDPSRDLGATVVDIQEVVTHEMLHALGFDHSAVTGRFDQVHGCQVSGLFSNDFDFQSSVFPIGTHTITGRTLSTDDIAGLRAVYPAGSSYGSIKGSIIDGATGQPVKGAHVVAVSTTDPDVPLVSTISGTGCALSPGDFEIEGLPPGAYYIRIEPLVGTTNPFVETNSFYRGFQTDFAAEFYSGAFESLADCTVTDADAQPISVAGGVKTSGVNVITNAQFAGPVVSSAKFAKGKLKISGSGFAERATEFEIDGVRFTTLKIARKSMLANGLATRFTSTDPGLGAVIPVGVTVQVVVVNTQTGQRSAPVPVSH